MPPFLIFCFELIFFLILIAVGLTVYIWIWHSYISQKNDLPKTTISEKKALSDRHELDSKPASENRSQEFVFSESKTPETREAAIRRKLDEKVRELSTKEPQDAANVVKQWLQDP